MDLYYSQEIMISKLDVKKTQEAIRYIPRRPTKVSIWQKSLAYHVFQHQCM